MSRDASGPRILSYADVGPAGAPAVLFLHGFLGSKEDWNEIVGPMKQIFRCLSVDLPGHGESTGFDAADYSPDGAAQLIVSLLDRLKLQRCHLVGYSMGGRLAMFLAVKYPERFERIVLESASAGLRSEELREARRSVDESRARELESMPLPQFLDQWYDQPLFGTIKREPERFRRLLARRQINDPRELARALRGLGTGSQPFLGDRLAPLPHEWLFAAGELDAKFAEIATELGERCPGSTVWIAAAAGHTLHFDQPAAYIETITRFLSEGI